MKKEYLLLCKTEIESLKQKKLIKPSNSPWSCTSFYVNKNSEIERGTPRLVINYKPLNEALQWIRYPIPNKKDFLDRLHDATIFSKFDMKSGFWQIQIREQDTYKTAFTVPFGHYEWNVLPFGVKNGPSEFQHIMNDIFNPFTEFIICYIDDVLIFSSSIEQHIKHLNIFKNVVIKNGLVVSAPKMKLFQKKIRFLGHNIFNGTIIPIDRCIEFASKFSDEIKDINQLQRFLGSLNYIRDYYPNLSQDAAILYIRNMNQSIILGTPFRCLLMPISKIDTLGIHTTLNNRHIVFEFITEPYTKELNQVKHMIYSKEKQINFIQKEIKFLSADQRILQPSLQGKIKLIHKTLQT
ncbi:MAG TPA: reverse transcriptase family protein [Flavobacterium sp.]|uniref:reverse transcriptase family protein n=1 Tax=Flavobacterium sp. TaxID=239 RepID=UPI002ED294DE